MIAIYFDFISNLQNELEYLKINEVTQRLALNLTFDGADIHLMKTYVGLYIFLNILAKYFTKQQL